MSALLWALACSGGSLKVDDTAPVVETGETPSALAGTWDAAVSGFVAFNEDWETEPYCSGQGSAEFDEQGRVVDADGDCVILWGPYVDVPGFWTLDGGQDELEMTFTWDEASRSLTVDTLTGQDDVWMADGLYTTSTGDEREARVQLVLTR